MALTEHLADLDPDRLTRLLDSRPDVLVEPVPRTFAALAARLTGADSLSRALTRMNRDEMTLVKAIALHGAAPVGRLAEWLGAPAELVGHTVDGLSARGLAWPVGDRIEIPEVLAGHFSDHLTAFQPVAAIARHARVADLATAVAGLGGDPVGLTRAGLADALRALLADRAAIRAAVDALPADAGDLFDAMLQVGHRRIVMGGPRTGAAQAALVRAGLFVAGPYGQGEIPLETAVALADDRFPPLSGAPEPVASVEPQAAGRPGAESALLAMTALLDEAAGSPLTAIKKGGVGGREQARLAKRLGISAVPLWIDIAAVLGLLGHGSGRGYPTTESYPPWRESSPARRWAEVAIAWYRLEHSPTSRHTPGRDIAPPLRLGTQDWMTRRALLTAAAGGASLAAVADGIGWYCPLYDEPYDDGGHDEYTGHYYDARHDDESDEPTDEPGGRAAAADVLRQLAVHFARHEGELLGLVVGDRLTDLGELLVDVADLPDAEDELARRAADLLPATAGLLVLQSDLTAVVSGQPSAAAARLLAAAAVPESRGVATTWRFGAASVRAAMDAGWTAAELRAALVEMSGHELPQPLDYLLSDVARRHGAVRIRSTTSCITGTEAEITEILHTRALAKLGLRRLAPTVLTASGEVPQLLAALRGAGFSPMPEDEDGSVIVAGQAPARPAVGRPGPSASAVRDRIPAAELAARLRSAPEDAGPASQTHGELAAIAGHLDPAAVVLLADALDHGRDVRIQYRNRAGNQTLRDIRPHELYGRYLSAWCHLRNAEREFLVDGIEAVGLVH